MFARHHASWCAAAFALLVALLAGWAGSANAATPPAAVGHDVSYPQCGGALPTRGSSGIVGISDFDADLVCPPR